jgi:hypothetical protein
MLKYFALTAVLLQIQVGSVYLEVLEDIRRIQGR